MTHTEKQWQLYYLDYYGTTENDIDGIFGTKSVGATRKFQVENGLVMDGIYGDKTDAKAREMIKEVQEVIAPYATSPLSKASYGLAGPKTVAATKAFQECNGLKVTGRADKETREFITKFKMESGKTNTPATIDPVTPAMPAPTPVPTPAPVQPSTNSGSWWDNIEFFDREEFRCKCGGKYCSGFPAEPNRQLVEIADDVRKHFNAPATVSSGLRCKIHNANSGGVSNSRHMTGKAMDFSIKGLTAAQILAYVKTKPGIRYSYDINGRYVHMDVQ